MAAAVLQPLSLLCIWLASQPYCPAHYHPCAASWCCSRHSYPSEDLSTVMAALPPPLLIDCPWLLSRYQNHVLGEVTKGLPSVMNVVPSPCSHSQQCWSQPGFLLVLGDIVPCLCVSCLLHLQLLVFLCLLALLRAHTWALFSPHRPLSLGVLHSHAAPCWLMVP